MYGHASPVLTFLAADSANAGLIFFVLRLLFLACFSSSSFFLVRFPVFYMFHSFFYHAPHRVLSFIWCSRLIWSHPASFVSFIQYLDVFLVLFKFPSTFSVIFVHPSTTFFVVLFSGILATCRILSRILFSVLILTDLIFSSFLTFHAFLCFFPVFPSREVCFLNSICTGSICPWFLEACLFLPLSMISHGSYTLRYSPLWPPFSWLASSLSIVCFLVVAFSLGTMPPCPLTL